MRRLFVSFLVLFCSLGYLCAEASGFVDDSQDIMTRVIIPENQHITKKTASVRIEYTPIIDEVRIFYTVLNSNFDQVEAMNSVLACLKDFQTQNQYFRYKFLRKDKKSFFRDENDIRWTVYSSHVKFYR